MTTLEEVTKMTAIDRAVKLIAEAGNEMKRVEDRAERAFPRWIEAQAAAAEAGLVTDLKLGPGMAAALSEYKQRKERAAAKEIAREEFHQPTHPVFDQHSVKV